MTRKILPLVILVGTLLVAGAFAGCGPKKTDTADALRRENDNLKGQVRRMDRLEEDNDELSADLADANQEVHAKDSEINELKIQLAGRGPGPSARSPEVFTVSGSVLFRFAESDLSSAGKRELDSIAADIKRRYPGQRISVEGHTDSVRLGKPATVKRYGRNVWLSAHRAWAVADYLIKRGISEKLVSVVGRGYSMPTGRGDDQDRRVEIIVLSR